MVQHCSWFKCSSWWDFGVFYLADIDFLLMFNLNILQGCCHIADASNVRQESFPLF